MKQRRFGVSLAAVATVLFLGLSFSSTPSATAVADRPERASRGAAAELQDLAHWVVAGARPREGRHQVILPEDLVAAMDSQPREISLFEPGPDPEVRRRFLQGLPYGTAISLAAERHQVDGLLVAAIVAVESGFAPGAVSPKGAKGLMQVRPLVGRSYGVDDLFDPYANVDVGSRYFGSLLAEYEGDLELTLAAYNAGPAAVARYGGVPPYRETRHYVRKVMARYEEYSRRAGEVEVSLLLGRTRI